MVYGYLNYSSMKTIIIQAAILLFILSGCSSSSVSGPDKQTKLQFDVKEGIPTYSLSYKGDLVNVGKPAVVVTVIGKYSGVLVADCGENDLFGLNLTVDLTGKRG